MAGVLEGIRVLEWAEFHAGPGAPAILGDMGAEVLKIEARGHGDRERGLAKFGEFPVTLPGGRNILFEASARNKKSLTLDVTKPQGREVLFRLVEKCDVFLTNHRKSTIAKLGLGYETLSQHNPQLIYAAVSGYGPEGPDSDRPAYDPLGLARSGLMTAMGETETPPQFMVFAVIDQTTAIMDSYQVVAALLARERLGMGQQVHVSLLSTGMFMSYCNMMAALFLGKEVPRHHRATHFNPLRNYYQCGDGKWLAFSHALPEKYWPEFCSRLGITELEKDPRFANYETRGKNAPELISILDRVFATKPREAWLGILNQSSGLAFAPVNSYLDLDDDPQVRENNYIVNFDHPALGQVKYPGFPITFSQTPAGIRSAAPELGQHTEEVLLEVAGYSWDEVTRLREQEVI